MDLVLCKSKRYRYRVCVFTIYMILGLKITISQIVSLVGAIWLNSKRLLFGHQFNLEQPGPQLARDE